MKVQGINNTLGVNTKGHLVNLGKYTKLAYSALFAMTLLSATDSFSKSSAKEPSTPDTEIVINTSSPDITENASLASTKNNTDVYAVEDAKDSTDVNNKGNWFFNAIYRLSEIIGKGASAIYS